MSIKNISLLLVILVVSLGCDFEGGSTSADSNELASISDSMRGDLPHPFAQESSSGFVASTSEFIEYTKRRIPELQKEFAVPGVAVAAVRDSKVVWSHGFGARSNRSKTPVTPSSVFEACSLSKPIFAYLVMQMVEAGEFDLDRPLVEYLQQDYIGGDERHRRITGRMALSHSSGFPNWRQSPAGRFDFFRERHHWEGNVLKPGRPLGLLFEPGQKQGYSGEGFLMLQLAIEKLRDESLTEWSHRDLFAPLGLTQTRFRWQSEFEERAAQGHDSQGRVLADTFDHDNAAYSLYTSPEDYARLMIEVMSPDRSANHSISRSSVKQMLTPQSMREGLSKFGLGWELGEVDGRLFAKHSGNNEGFRAFAYFEPGAGDAWVGMTNSENGMNLLSTLLEEIEALYEKR